MHQESLVAKTSHRSSGASPPGLQGFLFASGFENSYPVITANNGEDLRIDELAATRFYDCWRDDLALARDIGLTHLRYGPQYYLTHLGPGKYDWGFADETFAEIRKLGLVPIADLCHFGVPDWVGSFQNPEWPELYASYAAEFARRFDWVTLFTPVNEIFVNATFSALNGWWNERMKSDRAFVAAIEHLCRANVRAEEEILKVRPEAIFIQSEATSVYHERSPKAISRAAFENEKRFLSLDLSYGRCVASSTFEFLMDNGMDREQYHWLLAHGSALRSHCVMGSDYYARNEHWVNEDAGISPAGAVFGYALLAKHYFDRYHLPIMLTETNDIGIHTGPDWLWKLWADVRELEHSGIPVIGFTWYSVLDQVDWDSGLRENNGHVNPVGLYDLDRNIRPVGKAYRELIREWRDTALRPSDSP
jgi:beta-glucosidase/6-phospho-beta-glucosidase/beta-galactosidase